MHDKTKLNLQQNFLARLATKFEQIGKTLFETIYIALSMNVSFFKNFILDWNIFWISEILDWYEINFNFFKKLKVCFGFHLFYFLLIDVHHHLSSLIGDHWCQISLIIAHYRSLSPNWCATYHFSSLIDAHWCQILLSFIIAHHHSLVP